MRRVGIVTGLPAEARRLGRALGPDSVQHIACAGADPARARTEAEALLRRGAQALLSIGVAGGLDPGLPPGALAMAERVIGPDGQAFDADPDWRDRLLAAARAAALPLVTGLLAGTDVPVAGVGEKRALRDRTGALAVDMESHVVAAVASARGVPFLALRAVADPAGRAVPAAALAGLRPGGVRPLRVAAGVLRHPGELPALLRLAGDFRAALAALERAARALGPLALLAV